MQQASGASSGDGVVLARAHAHSKHVFPPSCNGLATSHVETFAGAVGCRCHAVDDGRLLQTLVQHKDLVTCIAASSDGLTVVSGAHQLTAGYACAVLDMRHCSHIPRRSTRLLVCQSPWPPALSSNEGRSASGRPHASLPLLCRR